MGKKRESASDVRRVALLKTDRRRADANRSRLAERSGDECLRHHDVLVLHRVMLADPKLRETELLYANDQFEIFVVAFRQRLVRR